MNCEQIKKQILKFHAYTFDEVLAFLPASFCLSERFYFKCSKDFCKCNWSHFCSEMKWLTSLFPHFSGKLSLMCRCFFRIECVSSQLTMIMDCNSQWRFDTFLKLISEIFEAIHSKRWLSTWLLKAKWRLKRLEKMDKPRTKAKKNTPSYSRKYGKRQQKMREMQNDLCGKKKAIKTWNIA